MKHICAISKADTTIDSGTFFDRITALLNLILAAKPIIELKKGTQSA